MEDNQFFYYVFKNCKKIYWNNKSLYNRERRADSVTAQYGLTKQAKTGLVCLDELYAEEKIQQIKNKIFLSKARFCINLASSYISHNDLKNESFIYLKK